MGRNQDAVFVFISCTPFIFLAYLPIFTTPSETYWAYAFQLFEHAAELVQLSDAAFQTDFFYTFVGKPQHPLRMGDPHLLQVSNQRHTKAVRKIPNRVTTQASSWIGFIEFSQKFYLPFLVPDPTVVLQNQVGDWVESFQTTLIE